MTKDEALKLALEALEMCEVPWTGTLDHNLTEAITAIKEALAQPEQEPCTKVECMGSKGCIGNCWNKKQPQQELVCVCGAVWEGQELIYTTPQRKPLTEQEIGAILEDINAFGTRLYTFARAIEAAHGIGGET